MFLDLQWFAKDGEGGEKTEEPTAKKLTDARNEGKVAKSKELDNAVGLLLLFVLLQVTMSNLGEGMIGVFDTFYNRISEYVKENSQGMTARAVSQILHQAILDFLWMVLPFFAVGFLAMVVINILQVKWKVTAKPLKPDFKKFNPINGFKRIFSKDSLMELFKSVAKIGLIAWVAYGSIQDNSKNLLLLYHMSLMQAIMLIGTVVIDTGMKISMAYFVLAIIDFIYQKWKFKDDMKMTKQEVKDEYKNTEGDPQIKGKQRQRMRERLNMTPKRHKRRLCLQKERIIWHFRSKKKQKKQMWKSWKINRWHGCCTQMWKSVRKSRRNCIRRWRNSWLRYTV